MTFKEQMVEMVKATGQELIDRAEELVGEGECTTDFDIWLSFPCGDGDISYPEIQVNRKYVNQKGFDVYIRREK